MQKEQRKSSFTSSIIWLVIAAVVVVATLAATKPVASVAAVPAEKKPASVDSFDQEFAALENAALANNGNRAVLKKIALID